MTMTEAKEGNWQKLDLPSATQPSAQSKKKTWRGKTRQKVAKDTFQEMDIIISGYKN